MKTVSYYDFAEENYTSLPFTASMLIQVTKGYFFFNFPSKLDSSYCC